MRQKKGWIEDVDEWLTFCLGRDCDFSDRQIHKQIVQVRSEREYRQQLTTKFYDKLEKDLNVDG